MAQPSSEERLDSSIKKGKASPQIHSIAKWHPPIWPLLLLFFLWGVSPTVQPLFGRLRTKELCCLPLVTMSNLRKGAFVIEILLSGCFAYSPDRKCFWGAPADQQDNIFSIHKKNVTLKLTFCCHQHSRGK